MDGERTVPAYGHVRLRLIFKPKSVGQRKWQLFVENLNNPDNTITLAITTSVSVECHRNDLSIQNNDGDVLPSGSTLQFGDCYVGMPMKKTLRIHNTTTSPIEVILSSDLAEEVSFELATEHSSSSKLFDGSSRRTHGASIDVIDDDPSADGGRLAYVASALAEIDDDEVEEEQEDEEEIKEVAGQEEEDTIPGHENDEDEDEDEDEMRDISDRFEQVRRRGSTQNQHLNRRHTRMR